MDKLPEKVLPYKTYNKIGHLSKSRLGEGDHYIDLKTEKILTSNLEDQTAFIIVQEKLDGSNVCVVRWKGELRVLGRSGYDCINSNQEQHRMFHKWVMDRKDRFDALLPNEEDRVVGEWLALAHGTIYKLSHEPFVPFDLFKKEKRLPFLETYLRLISNSFTIPGIIHLGGACSVERALKILDKKNYHGAEETEGVIYRLERPEKEITICKMVKHNKEDGKYLKEGKEIWNWRDL